MKNSNKIIIMLFLLIIACFLTYYFHAAYKTQVIFTHFFYIPIVLSVFWWKRKGIAIAVFLAGILLLSNFIFKPHYLFINDFIRASFFIIFPFFVIKIVEWIERYNIALKRSEIKYKTLVEHLPLKIFIKNRNLVYTSCNKNYADDLGIRPEDINDKTDYDFFPKELAERYRTDDKRIIEKGLTEDIEEEYIEHGEERWVRTVKTPYKNEKGDIVGILGVFRDITEQKKMQDMLWESQERYKALVENTIVGVTVIDTNYRIIMSNSAIAKLFNKPASDFVGKNCFREYEKRQAICSHCPGRKAMATGKTVEVQTRGVRDDGSIFYVHNLAIPYRDINGKMKGFIEIVEDVTERKKAGEDLRKAYNELRETQVQLIQLEKAASIGQLAAGVAHEINNPLFAVSCEAEMLLKDKPQDKEAKESLKVIIEQTKRISTIVNELLKFSQKKDFKKELLNINDAVEKSISLLSYSAGVKNINIVKKLGTNLPKIIGDINLLQEVFLNIMLNAVQAMGKGGTLTIITHDGKEAKYGRRATDLFKQGQEFIVVEVKDTGCGMDKNTLGRLFDPFYSTKEKHTGLGLPICYRVIQDHKGSIEAKSQIGKGATFTVKLPVLKEGKK